MISGIIWAILGIALIIAETFTTGFILLWFGLGALAAALVAFTGINSLLLQLTVFLIVSVLLTIASRTIFEEFFMRYSPGKDIKTGMDSLPGQVGIVVEASQGSLAEGAVQVFGAVWKARPVEGEAPLVAGEQVQVERVQGLTVYVSRPDSVVAWRASSLARDNQQ